MRSGVGDLDPPRHHGHRFDVERVGRDHLVRTRAAATRRPSPLRFPAARRACAPRRRPWGSRASGRGARRALRRRDSRRSRRHAARAGLPGHRGSLHELGSRLEVRPHGAEALRIAEASGGSGVRRIGRARASPAAAARRGRRDAAAVGRAMAATVGPAALHLRGKTLSGTDEPVRGVSGGRVVVGRGLDGFGHAHGSSGQVM